MRTKAVNLENSATVPLLSPNYLKGQLSEISAMKDSLRKAEMYGMIKVRLNGFITIITAKKPKTNYVIEATTSTCM